MICSAIFFYVEKEFYFFCVFIFCCLCFAAAAAVGDGEEIDLLVEAPWLVYHKRQEKGIIILSTIHA